MLEVEGLHTFYGDSHVLHGIDLHVAQGECVAILGRNGAGKSTTLRSIVGLTPARRGRVLFRGLDVTRAPTRRTVMAGIAYVPEDRGIFASVTVHEHLRLALSVSRRREGVRTPEEIYAMFPRLAERRHSLGGSLSGGEQQMLAIGRALALKPSLLILDEPSEGLAPVIVEQLGAVLGQVRRAGTPILLVEQNYALAMSLADRAYVLSQGQVRFHGTARELQASQAMLDGLLSV